MVSVSDKSCKGDRNNQFVSNHSFLSQVMPLMKIISQNPAEADYNKIWRICFACWISKVTRAHAHVHGHAPGHPHANSRAHTHRDKYVILIGFATAPQCYDIRTLAVLVLC